MNKRLERVEIAKNGLRKIHNELHDARFDGGDMILELDNGYIFFIQGFTTRESFDKAMGDAKSQKEADKLYDKSLEGIRRYAEDGKGDNTI